MSTPAPRILVDPQLDPGVVDDAQELAGIADHVSAIVISSSHSWIREHLDLLDPSEPTHLDTDAHEGSDRIRSSHGPIVIILVTDSWHRDEIAVSLAGLLAAAHHDEQHTACAEEYTRTLDWISRVATPTLVQPLALPELLGCPAPVGAQSLRHQRWHNPELAP